MNSTFLILIFAIFILSGCTEETPKLETESQEKDTIKTEQTTTETRTTDMHTSETSLDWAGTYTGVMPCADCEGIETVLTLNQDDTYTLEMTYLGKNVDPFAEKGTFKWSDDGGKITLVNDEGSHTQFLVGENFVTQLDGDGNLITGEMADKFTLKKVDRN